MIRNMRVVVLCACIAGVLSPTGAYASTEMRSGIHETSTTASTHAARAQTRLPQAERQASVLAMEDVRPVSAEAVSPRLGFGRGERASAARDEREAGDESSPVGSRAVLIVGLGIALISIARRMGRY